MIDENEAVDSRHEGLERVSERMGVLLAEAAEALRNAADAYLDEQKDAAAKRLADISEALKQCARALEASENETMAHYADRAAAQLAEASTSLHERDWRALMQEAERFARREPVLYLAGALAAGFLGGWFLIASSDRRRSSTEAEPGQKEGESTPVTLRPS